MIPAGLLLLADPRLPAGGHAHSGGIEPATMAGLVQDDGSLREFLTGRLTTVGLVTAALAAAAWRECTQSTPRWRTLDAEADARTPSVAQRAASRAQGRGLLRAARAAWPSAVLDGLAAAVLPHRRPRSDRDDVTFARSNRDDVTSSQVGPHHAIVLGACAFIVGGTAQDAAAVAAMGAVTGPASAAVRLLGLDPLRVHAVLAELGRQIDAVATEAATMAGGTLAELPASSAPMLEILAELHTRQEVRLFES